MTDLVLPRRRFLLGLAAALAAPAIVKAESLMRCTGVIIPPKPTILRYSVVVDTLADGWMSVGGYKFQVKPDPIIWKPYTPVAAAA